jgi:hypothetical protein
MPRNLHEYYDQLTEVEKRVVDESFRSIYAIAGMGSVKVPLKGDDDAEVAVDAVAKWIILSRKK